jgi:hypothetical protein
VGCAETPADVGERAYLRRRQASEEMIRQGLLKGGSHAGELVLAFGGERDERESAVLRRGGAFEQAAADEVIGDA